MHPFSKFVSFTLASAFDPALQIEYDGGYPSPSPKCNHVRQKKPWQAGQDLIWVVPVLW